MNHLGSSRAIRSSRLMPKCWATSDKMPERVPTFKGEMARDGHMVLTLPLGCQSHVTAGLAGDVIVEGAKQLGEFRA